MAIKYWLDGDDDWSTPADWTGGTVPGSGDDVTLEQGSPHVRAPITIKSLTDSSPASVSFENAGSNTISTNLTLSGYLALDQYSGQGGTTLSVTNLLTNTGSLHVGNGGLAAVTSLSTHLISNTGTIELDGSATKQASIVVGNSAGFGTSSTLTGTVGLFGDALVSFTSGQIKTLAVGSSLRLNGPNAYIADVGSTSSNSALTGLATIGKGAKLFLDNGAAVAPGASLNNYGAINLDYYNGEGGSSLQVGGHFTNFGTMQIGNGGLATATSLTTHYLVNQGTIELDGATAQASLNVGYAAGFGTSYTVTGAVRLFGNTLISFASGQITTIAGNSSLRLDGANAFVADTGSTTSNSALTGLRTISHNGTFMLDNGAAVSAAGIFNNYGTTNLDYFNGEGGSTLNVASRLTNVGSLQIGNGGLSSSDPVSTLSLTNTGTIELDAPAVQTGTLPADSPRAVLDVGSVAGFGTSGIVTGTVRLIGNTLVEFASGQIKSLAANSYLRLDGATALVADASDTNSNSALTGLADINTGAQFLLDNAASVSVAKNLTNNGTLDIDYYSGEGGASLSVGGKLDNENSMQVGNGAQTVADRVTASTLTNNGTISLYGNAASANNPVGATLAVNSAAGTGSLGHLSGSVSLAGDALLQFTSGQIQTIDGSLRLNGSNAYVADASLTTSNSALTGLDEVDGSLALDNSASVSISADLVDYGSISLDNYNGEGGSLLSVVGNFDNENLLGIGNGGLSLGDMMSVGSLTNGGSGAINLTGTGTVAAKLIVNSAAGTGTAGILTGSVSLTGDTLLQFAGGQIQTIDSDGSLRLNGSTAFVADAGSTTSNSALTGLSEVDGSLAIENGGSISTGSGLTNFGTIRLDQYNGEGGGSMTVAGNFDNENELDVGNGGLPLGDTFTATSLTNNGTINLQGNASATTPQNATLAVSGSVVNNGSINVSNDKQTFGGAVTGLGVMTLSNNSTVEFGSSVASSQTVSFSGAGKLLLDAAKSFAASISNFVTGDSLDLKGFGSGTTFNFTENHAGTGGTLAVTFGANTAQLAFNGSYSNASFAAPVSDGTGGSIIAHA